jgi:hypothetical protein
MLPKVFAIYRRDEETFQLIQTERNEAGEIQRLKGWARPEADSWNGISEREKDLWFMGAEWYVEPTGYIGAEPILHNCILHDKHYKWWSAHHKLVWSNWQIYSSREGSGADLWHDSPHVPIIEFNNKHVYPREYIPFYPRWASAMPQDLEAELDRARHAYLTDLHQHVDPSELRIATPKEKASDIHKRRSVSPMPSDTESDLDVHEIATEFTPGAPKVHSRVVAKHLNYMFDSQEELEQSWTPCMALTVLGACLIGTWGLIGMHVFGY